MARRRLLVFTENYARGGGNRYCVDLINALADSYDEVVLASNEGGIFPEDSERLAPNVVIQSVGFLTRSKARHSMRRFPKIVRAPWLLGLSLAEPLLFAGNVRSLSAYIRKIGPDAVLGCNGGYPAARATLALVVAARQCQIPAALSVVSMPTPRRKNLAAYDRALDSRVWSAVRLVIVNARAIAGALEQQHEMPAVLSRTIYNGLSDAPYSAIRKENWNIGFVSRLDAAKGVMVLLEAFRGLAAKWPKLRLQLVGDGDASAALRKRIGELGLEGRVEASGFAEGDVKVVLESFRIYVFPSFHEGLPYSILEAMRAGCTIVSTSVGGIPEILRDGVDGLLVPPRDADALSKAIDRLLSDEDEAHRLGRAARERFERNYQLDNFAATAVHAFAEAGLLQDSGLTIDV
jgi:glycosyltransferase involved in cell wall biosynthesis